MTREALGIMAPHEVEAVRWGLFARALEPVISADVDARLTELADAEKAPSAGTLSRRRGEFRERLHQAKIAQAAVRQMLMLDDEDE